MKKTKIITIFGTRPEAIKMVPVIREIKKWSNLEPVVVTTGQHREMIDQALKVFGLKPDYDLNIMQTDQKLYEVSSRAIISLEKVFQKGKLNFDLINSTLK